ncbi:MAG: class I SAM-dependent methyltransferase [Candidatus Poseidoniaceae archaeon]|jgi:hypothetical protein|nr:class I SAM-dependent methyltransferase [Candidatus Poseidoniaceae archaeon]
MSNGDLRNRLGMFDHSHRDYLIKAMNSLPQGSKVLIVGSGVLGGHFDARAWNAVKWSSSILHIPEHNEDRSILVRDIELIFSDIEDHADRFPQEFNFVQADCTDLSMFEDDSIGMVICLGVFGLEFKSKYAVKKEGWVAAMTEFKRVTIKEGLCLFSVSERHADCEEVMSLFIEHYRKASYWEGEYDGPRHTYLFDF